MDDNVFSPGDAGGSASSSPQNFDPAPVDLMAIFERAWRLMLDNLAIVAVGIVLMLGTSILSTFIVVPIQLYGDAQDGNTPLMFALLRFAVQIIFAIVQMYFQLGLLKALINLDRGAEAEMATIWSQTAVIVPAILASIIVGLATMVGFILLIIPGIIVALGLSMTLLRIVDEGVDPVSAVQESWEMTDGHKGFLFLQGIVMFMVTLLVYLVTCCLGAPIAVGMYCCVQAVTYNAIRGAR